MHHGFLGASPDGLVHDPSAEDTGGLLELKYVQMEKQEILEEALVRKGICKKCKDGVALNVQHKYYFQTEQAMFEVMGNGCTTTFCERIISHKNTGIQPSQSWNHFLTTGLYQNLHILV